MERKELCEKDGILITYNDENVCFEDLNTAESILIKNDGTILDNNFDAQKTDSFMLYFKQIYPAVTTWRSLDTMETA